MTRVDEIASALGTGNKARSALGAALVQLNGAYGSVAAYNPDDLSTTGWGEDAVTVQGTEYLDGIRTRAESDFALLPADDYTLDASLNRQIAFDIASIETATKQMATLGTAWGDLLDTAAGLVPKPPGGWSWWIIGAVVAAIVLLYLWKKPAT